MSETLKKNWFVILIAIIFIGFAIFCVYDTNKGKLAGKKDGGESVVASLDGDTNITANELYDEMYKAGGDNLILLQFQAAVIDASVETSDEIKTSANSIRQYVEYNAATYATQYGQSSEEYLTSLLANYGYTIDTIDDFCRIQAKMSVLQNDYISRNLEELFTPIAEKNNGRIVSHILVKMEDANNPTAEELATVEAIEKDLETMSFAEVAKKYADKGDTSSAENGGYLGYMDSTTSYVDSFKTQALKMKAGETSEWVKESNSSYNGWHMIYVHETDVKKMLADENAKDSIISAVASADTTISTKYIKEAAEKLDIEYYDDDIKALIEEKVLTIPETKTEETDDK